jgi:hypothetical protein
MDRINVVHLYHLHLHICCLNVWVTTYKDVETASVLIILTSRVIEKSKYLNLKSKKIKRISRTPNDFG